jgi:hypothetical protein
MQPRQRAVAAGAALVALIGLWWGVRAQRGASVATAGAAARPIEPVLATRRVPEHVAALPALAPPPPDRIGEVLAQYRHDAVYPPGSRPLDEGAAYKLRWNDAIVSDLPFDDGARGGLLYHFAADRHHVTFGESLTSWIEVWPAADPSARVPVTITNAWVMVTSGEAQGRALALAYHDDGRDGDVLAGDGRYTNRFTPAEHDELRASRQVQLRAEVESGGVRRAVIRDFTFAARPVLELHGVEDAVVDGSLVAALDVEVFERGLYTFEANLVTADGDPVAYVDQSVSLDAGRQRVPLAFFGKVLRDRGLSGPYVVRDLRGFERFLDGAEANLWWQDARTHKTRPYAVTDFSAAEWDAPEKREKIRRMEAAMSGR